MHSIIDRYRHTLAVILALVVVFPTFLLATEDVAEAHIPHTEYESYESHTCYPPVWGATLTAIRPRVTYKTNVTGYHDVGVVGWYDGYSGSYSKSAYLYLRAGRSTSYTFYVNVPDVWSPGIGYVTINSGWMRYISSLEHNNVYIDTVTVYCDWNWPTA